MKAGHAKVTPLSKLIIFMNDCSTSGARTRKRSPAGIATWYHNGVLKRTSGAALAFPMYAMGYFQTRGARLEGVRLY